jgi:hypothetical protein
MTALRLQLLAKRILCEEDRTHEKTFFITLNPAVAWFDGSGSVWSGAFDRSKTRPTDASQCCGSNPES